MIYVETSETCKCTFNVLRFGCTYNYIFGNNIKLYQVTENTDSSKLESMGHIIILKLMINLIWLMNLIVVLIYIE